MGTVLADSRACLCPLPCRFAKNPMKRQHEADALFSKWYRSFLSSVEGQSVAKKFVAAACNCMAMTLYLVLQ